MAILLVSAGVIIVVAWFFAGPYVAGVVRTKLITLVAQQLNARLEIGKIRYVFPYGVDARDAALYSTAPGEPSIKLVGFDQLNLTLGRFPLRSGPLIIQRIDVQKPTLYVVEDKKLGFIGLEHLFRNTEEKSHDKEAPPKLSDFLRLRHVQLTDARIEYDDRTISKSVPFVWDKLGLNLDAQALKDGPSKFHFKAGAGNDLSARIDTNGAIDLDTLVLDLDNLSITTNVTPGQRNSPLPAGVQRVLNTLGVAGSGRATITGTVPILEGAKLDLKGDFVIDDAKGRLSPDGKPLSDLNVTGKIAMLGREVTVKVDLFSCRRGTIGASLQPATVIYNLKTNKWNVSPIRAAIAYAPPIGVDGIRNQHAVVQVSALMSELKERDQFRLNLEGTTISLPDTAGDLTLAGTVRYDDDGITLEALRLEGLGGPVTLAGVINENAAAIAGELDVVGVDLDRLNKLVDPGTEKSLTGKLNAHVKAAATDTLDAVRGEGRFRVTGGQFAKVPILGGMAEKMKIGEKAFIAHEAAGVFTLGDNQVKFSRVAISTDVLSVVGVGSIGFDSKLDLSLYADGHWHDKPKPGDFYIPLLSDIARGVSATGAYVFGSVSRQFTHFTVTGTLDKPKLTPSPAPVLGESVERILGREP